MNQTKTKKIVLSSILAALVCVATYIIKIPFSSQGYFNIGDCVVLLCGWILTPAFAFLAAGIGSALADIFSGYIVYALPTFIIKGLMAVSAHYIYKLLSDRINTIIARALSGLSGELVMILGYFITEIFMYGLLPAALNIPGSAFQGIVGFILSMILINIFKKNKIIK